MGDVCGMFGECLGVSIWKMFEGCVGNVWETCRMIFGVYFGDVWGMFEGCLELCCSMFEKYLRLVGNQTLSKRLDKWIQAIAGGSRRAQPSRMQGSRECTPWVAELASALGIHSV